MQHHGNQQQPGVKHVKYEKMGEDTLGASAIAAGVAVNAQFIVTEKVHGANFCILVHSSAGEGGGVEWGEPTVCFAKRTAVLSHREDFFSFRSAGLANSLQPAAISLYKDIRAKLSGDRPALRYLLVRIYGELFGGAYPHPSVPALRGILPVQKGIWYSPTIAFMGFDVNLTASSVSTGGPPPALPSPVNTAVPPAPSKPSVSSVSSARPAGPAAGKGQTNSSSSSNEGSSSSNEGSSSVSSSWFLEFGRARALCERHGVMFAAPLFVGRLPEALSFNKRFNSTIPKRLNLPELQQPNLAEGVVVRPVKEPPTPRPGLKKSGGGKESARGLLKRKIKEFSEKKYQNNGWKAAKEGGGGGGGGAEQPKEKLVHWEVLAHVTPQRLDNVLSKIGRIEASDKEGWKQALQDLQQDVLSELDGQDAALVRGTPWLMTTLIDECKKTIVAHVKAILKGQTQKGRE